MNKIQIAFVFLIVLASAKLPSPKSRLLSVIASNLGAPAQQVSLNGLGTILPIDPSRCQAGEVMTPSGCWSSCADPRFKKCPDAFITIYRPDFCAYTSDGKYVSETFECQACQRKDAFAVRKGACSCDFVRCKKGEAC